MAHNTHSRAIVPESLAACALDYEPRKDLHDKSPVWWTRYWITKYATDEEDQKTLLAMILGE